jgi:hypothetical protein
MCSRKNLKLFDTKICRILASYTLVRCFVTYELQPGVHLSILKDVVVAPRMSRRAGEPKNFILGATLIRPPAGHLAVR